jgi:predicted DCC family thiol-disulfide oxidoreductase YuxK
MERPIILFDGVCNLCNAAVDFVLARDTKAVFRFASLQSPVGQQLVIQCGMGSDALETMVLVEQGRCYVRSTAALRVVRRLRSPWPAFYTLIVLPRPIRDLVYGWVARNRYGWFGKRETCRLPTAAESARFIE